MTEDANAIARMLPDIAVNLRLGALFSHASLELSPNQLLTLLVLGAQSAGASSGQVAGALGISLPGMTAIADRLSELGMLKRERDPDDRRVVLLALSAKGTAAYERVQAALTASVARALHDLDAATRSDLRDAVRQVRQFSDQFARGHQTGLVGP